MTQGLPHMIPKTTLGAEEIERIAKSTTNLVRISEGNTRQTIPTVGEVHLKNNQGGTEMKAMRKLSDILEALENRGISPEEVVVDPRAIGVIEPSDEDEPDPDEED